jgi:hypothetical protein
VEQGHCQSNKCRNGAATANECHGQGQKLQSLNVKHVCHLQQQNALAGQIHILEAVRAVVQNIYSSVWGIVLECLGYHRLYSRQVQENCLTNRSSAEKATTLTILQSCKAEDSNFLSSVITGDETWLHHYSLWTKMQTMVWNHSTYSANNRFKATVGIWKVIATINLNICRFILIYFMPCGVMVTAFAYQLI